MVKFNPVAIEVPPEVTVYHFTCAVEEAINITLPLPQRAAFVRIGVAGIVFIEAITGMRELLQ